MAAVGRANMNQYKASELAQEFQQAEKKKKEARKKAAMQKVAANVTMGNSEMVTLFAEVLRCFATGDVQLKRMCYAYLRTYAAARPESALQFLPLVRQDLRSGSTRVAALALQNMCSVPLREFTQAAVEPLRQFLDHDDAYLRRTAAFCVARLFERDQKLVIGECFINDLNGLLTDPNTSVLAGALTALYDITEKCDALALTITKPHASSLADSLAKCDEWCQVAILNALMNYVPQTHDDAMCMVDKVIPHLQHTNSAVVLNAFKLLIYLLNFALEIEDYITRKLAHSLVSLLSKPAEIQFLILRNVILLILSKPNLLPFEVSVFFCAYNDPIYVKDTKLEIIYLLANEHNLLTVIDELKVYGTEIDIQMSRKAIRAIGNLAVKLDCALQPCIDALLELLTNDIDYIVQESIIVFKNILRRYNHNTSNQLSKIVFDLLKHVDKIHEPDAKSALIWIVAEYCDRIPNANILLQDLTFTFIDDPTDVQLTSLTSSVKLFLRKPELGEKLVIKLLKLSTDHVNNPDVRDRAFFYWNLLSVQDKYPGTAKEIIDKKLPPISSQNEQLDPVILEELVLNIGTLASIYLKPVGQIFRLAKRKFIPPSPARSRASSSSRPSTLQKTRLTGSSSTLASSNSSGTKISEERHIDSYDVQPVTVKPLKRQNTLTRRLNSSTSKPSMLSRKFSFKK